MEVNDCDGDDLFVIVGRARPVERDEDKATAGDSTRREERKGDDTTLELACWLGFEWKRTTHSISPLVRPFTSPRHPPTSSRWGVSSHVFTAPRPQPTCTTWGAVPQWIAVRGLQPWPPLRKVIALQRGIRHVRRLTASLGRGLAREGLIDRGATGERVVTDSSSVHQPSSTTWKLCSPRSTYGPAAAAVTVNGSKAGAGRGRFEIPPGVLSGAVRGGSYRTVVSRPLRRGCHWSTRALSPGLSLLVTEGAEAAPPPVGPAGSYTVSASLPFLGMGCGGWKRWGVLMGGDVDAADMVEDDGLAYGTFQQMPFPTPSVEALNCYATSSVKPNAEGGDLLGI